MKFEYQVSDGYIHGNAPHYVEIDDDEIRDCMDVAEAMTLIEDAIQADFERNVSPAYDFEAIKAEVEKLTP